MGCAGKKDEIFRGRLKVALLWNIFKGSVKLKIQLVSQLYSKAFYLIRSKAVIDIFYWNITSHAKLYVNLGAGNNAAPSHLCEVL